VKIYHIVVMAVFLVMGCAKKQTKIEYPDRLPITEQAERLTMLPEYQKTTESGQVVAVEKGSPAPFSGICMTEDKGFAVAELRTSYDEVYFDAQSNRKYFLTVVGTQEKELYRADQIIDKKDKKIDELQSDWWAQNKFDVGVGIGIVAGVAMSVLVGYVWSEIENQADQPVQQN